MIYVTLPSINSMDIYPDNKILSFKLSLPETLLVGPEHWEVAPKEIQFPHYPHFIGWYNTVIGRPCNKRIEVKLMKEIISDYYSSMPDMVAEMNTKMPAEPKTINSHSNGFDIRFDYDSFSSNSIVTISWSINKSGEIGLGYVIGIQGE